MPIPPDAHTALPILHALFSESLVAVYLHGSAVTGGLRPHSDVDLLAVIDGPMTRENGKRFAAALMAVSGRYPRDPAGRRPLEVIVFSRTDLAVPAYPMRCEFIYGEWLRHAYEEGSVPAPMSDPELTLVLTQARREAKPLFGPDANELLPVIPQADIRRAIGDMLPSLCETLEEDERNVLLTLARMWRTLATGEFVPKGAAADWAIARLPDAHAAVLAHTRDAYLGFDKNDWHGRQVEIRETARVLRDYVEAGLDLFP